MIYLSQTGLKLVLTINPYISTNSENFDVGVKGQEISEGNGDIFNSFKENLNVVKLKNKDTLLEYLGAMYLNKVPLFIFYSTTF